MSRVAACLTLGELGPFLQEVFFDGREYTRVGTEFENDDQALSHWASLELEGYLVHAEGRVWWRGNPQIMSCSLDQYGGSMSLYFDAGLSPGSSLAISGENRFIADTVMGLIPNIPGYSQETRGNIVNIHSVHG